MDNKPDRLICLREQYSLLKAREQRLAHILRTLENGVSVNDKSVSDAIEKHIKFLQQDMSIDANGFAKCNKTCPFYQGRFCF